MEPGLQSAARDAEARFIATRSSAIAFREELKRPHLFTRQMASGRGARGHESRAESAASARPSREIAEERGTRSARHVPRPRARGRSQHPVHDGAVSRGGNRAADQRSAHDDRTVRRRRARRYAVRRRLLHLPARQLGARAAGADAGARGQADHVGAGRLLRHQGSRPAAAGLAADIAIFDYNTVGSAKRARMRNDLPGGGRRW